MCLAAEASALTDPTCHQPLTSVPLPHTLKTHALSHKTSISLEIVPIPTPTHGILPNLAPSKQRKHLKGQTII